jgi:hypothetical protein
VYLILGIDKIFGASLARADNRSIASLQTRVSAPQCARTVAARKNRTQPAIAPPGGFQGPRKSRVKVGARRIVMRIDGPSFLPTPPQNVELERLGDEIVELAAHLDAATARLLELIREFDARGGWGNGFASCADWLTWRVGLALGAAREHVRVARALGSLPKLKEALTRGELSYSKVRALTRVATPETEERLLAVGRAGTTEHVELIVRGWRRMDRKAEAEETTRRHRHRALRVYPEADGMVVIRGRLEPEVGAVVMQALAAARETLYRRRKGGRSRGNIGRRRLVGGADHGAAAG